MRHRQAPSRWRLWWKSVRPAAAQAAWPPAEECEGAAGRASSVFGSLVTDVVSGYGRAPAARDARPFRAPQMPLELTDKETRECCDGIRPSLTRDA